MRKRMTQHSSLTQKISNFAITIANAAIYDKQNYKNDSIKPTNF